MYGNYIILSWMNFYEEEHNCFTYGDFGCYVSSPLTVTAEEIDNNDLQEIYVTLSVDEFAEFAADYGYSVTIADSNTPSPHMHQTGEYEFTDNSYHKIDTDSVIINEEAQIQNIEFRDNIDSVDVKFYIGTSQTAYETKKIKSGGHSNTVSIPAGKKYSFWMRVNSSTPLSAKNPGIVSYYWTDRGWELV